MVQRAVDPLTGADRDEILISDADLPASAARRATGCGSRSATGVFHGRLRPAPIRDGNLEVHWPEGNVLLAGARARSGVARARLQRRRHDRARGRLSADWHRRRMAAVVVLGSVARRTIRGVAR